MDRINFTFDETNEDVVFMILGSVLYEEETYLLVVEEDEIEDDDMTAYVLKAIAEEDEDVIYELVDDDDELDAVSELFEEILENFDIEKND